MMNDDNSLPEGDLAQAPHPFTDRVAQAEKVEQQKKSNLLSRITHQKRRRPFFGLLYGPPGVGKSTFGSQLPAPLLIGAERGLDQISVDKLEGPKNFVEFYGWLEWLSLNEHAYQSIVIDTCDAVELLIFEQVIKEWAHKTQSRGTEELGVDDIGGG